eukprot:Opistho-2@88726
MTTHRPLCISSTRHPALHPTGTLSFFRVRETLPDGTVVVAGKSVKHPDMPKSSDFTRAKILSSGTVLRKTADGKTSVVYAVQLDPCGLVPAFIANIVAEKQPLVISVIRNKLAEKKQAAAN